MTNRIARWLLVGGVVLLVVSLLGGTVVAANLSSLRDKASDVAGAGRGDGQSASQISPEEFRRAKVGMTTDALRARVGEPEAKSRHAVEGLAIECWLYGAAGTTGGFQFCFANGRLRTKFAYAA